MRPVRPPFGIDPEPRRTISHVLKEAKDRFMTSFPVYDQLPDAETYPGKFITIYVREGEWQPPTIKDELVPDHSMYTSRRFRKTLTVAYGMYVYGWQEV